MVEDAVARNTAEWRKSNPEAWGQEIMCCKLVIRHQEWIRLWEKVPENEHKRILALQQEDRQHGNKRSVLQLEPFANVLDETTESISSSNHNVIVYELTYLQENPSWRLFFKCDYQFGRICFACQVAFAFYCLYENQERSNCWTVSKHFLIPYNSQLFSKVQAQREPILRALDWHPKILEGDA